ncbi:MAG: redoxin domain-containing protein [Chloroflexi bacterium]|nr:redoxin domain-containing protein [Chloroflexota bacterium]
MRKFQSLLEDFRRLDTQVWGVSIDRTPIQKAFADHCGLQFPMVSGHPLHEGAKALGVFDEERVTTRRVTFVVDKQGVVRHVIDDPQNMERHAVESLEVVRGVEGKG